MKASSKVGVEQQYVGVGVSNKVQIIAHKFVVESSRVLCVRKDAVKNRDNERGGPKNMTEIGFSMMVFQVK